MSTESIEKRIRADAEAQATKLVAQAEAEAAQRLDAAQERSRQRTAAAAEAARTAGEQRRQQQATARRAAGKLKLLALRAELLDEVFNAAAERFAAQRDGAYRQWLAAQLAAVAGKTGSVVPAERDRELIASMLPELDTDGLTLSENNATLLGGFLLVGDRIDVNLSLDTRLAEVKAELLPGLAKRAFETRDE